MTATIQVHAGAFFLISFISYDDACGVRCSRQWAPAQRRPRRLDGQRAGDIENIRRHEMHILIDGYAPQDAATISDERWRHAMRAAPPTSLTASRRMTPLFRHCTIARGQR